MTNGDRTREGLRRGAVLREIVTEARRPVATSLEPTSAYEAITRQMVNDLTVELRALRARIDSLFTLVVGAIVLDLLMRLAGLG